MIKIEKVNNIEDAKKCNKLLTKLIYSEKKYNENIDEKYVVESWFENLYKNEDNIICITKDEQNIVGYIYCKIITGPTLSLEALIDGLYIEENYRRQGIATKLLEQVKMWCKQKNIKYIYLNVLEKNKSAMELYHKQNFEDFERKLKFEI